MNQTTQIRDNEESPNFNETMQLGMDRNAMLTICLENFFEKVSSSVSELEYCEALGKITKSKSVPGKVRNKMKMKLFQSLSDEVNLWIEEEDMNNKLNKLDKIVKGFSSLDNFKAWRPNGNVEDYMRSFTMAARLKRMSAVEDDVKDRERATESLREQVSATRSKTRALLHSIKVIGESSSNYKALNSLDSKINEQLDILAHK